MKIYIIRHGQTEWNRSGRLQGQTDISLNENGRELAKKVGQALRELPIDRVISSPLKRSLETAWLVLKENSGRAGEALRAGESWRTEEGNGIIAGRAGNVLMTDERIKEISFGEYEGYSVPASSLFAGDDRFAITDPDFHNFFDAPDKYRPPQGGESFAGLMERTGNFLGQLAKEESMQKETLLISTHGAAARALLANIKHTALKEFWYPGVPKNCSVSVAVTENESWKLLEQDVIYY